MFDINILEILFPTVQEKAHLKWHVVDGISGKPELDPNKSILLHCRATDDQFSHLYNLLMGPVKVRNLLPDWGWTHTGNFKDVMKWAYDE